MNTRPILESTREHGDVTRHVAIYRGGVRVVINTFHGESWTTYVIVPRPMVIAALRRWGRPNDIAELLPESASQYLGPEYYGGPGRTFYRAPCRILSSRRYVVYAQSGGLDI